MQNRFGAIIMCIVSDLSQHIRHGDNFGFCHSHILLDDPYDPSDRLLHFPGLPSTSGLRRNWRRPGSIGQDAVDDWTGSLHGLPPGGECGLRLPTYRFEARRPLPLGVQSNNVVSGLVDRPSAVARMTWPLSRGQG